jgi:regulator of protease activity HflC (stomatin/prohibitin superfamily)
MGGAYDQVDASLINLNERSNMEPQYTLTPKQVGLIFKTIFATLLGLWILFTSITVVGVGKVGVVTRFGRVNREMQSGLNMKFPWPIERVAKMDVQIQKEQADAAASTNDLQDVTTTLALNYHLDLTRVGDIYRNIGTDYKKRVIDPAIQEAFKAVASQYTASDLLKKRPEVKQHAYENLKARLDKSFIIVDDVSIVNFQFSHQFTQAIEAKQVAQQQAEQALYDVQKAQNQANAAVAAAEGQAKAQELLRQTLTPEIPAKDGD